MLFYIKYIMKNIDDGELKICSLDPVTGYSRDGYCRPQEDDFGSHLVCAKMTEDFLEHSKKVGNDLSSVVKKGENWCLCQDRYHEATKNGINPEVIREATSNKIKENIKAVINNTKKRGGKKNKKTKKRSKKIRAICVLHENKNGVTGKVFFSQNKNSSKVKVEYEIYGLSDGKHGFHVHEYGDVTDNCMSACSHFNPFGKVHGGRKSKERHVGDLGNIISKNNVAKGYFYDKIISLKFNKKNCIVGRSIVVHEDEDDLGKGGNEESLKTGNAGKRLACGVIGLRS